jgi:hypothetical protein
VEHERREVDRLQQHRHTLQRRAGHHASGNWATIGTTQFVNTSLPPWRPMTRRSGDGAARAAFDVPPFVPGSDLVVLPDTQSSQNYPELSRTRRVGSWRTRIVTISNTCCIWRHCERPMRSAMDKRSGRHFNHDRRSHTLRPAIKTTKQWRRLGPVHLRQQFFPVSNYLAWPTFGGRCNRIG